MGTIYIKQGVNEGYARPYNMDEFIKNVMIFSPFVVETQEEFDWLWAMQLMIGKEYVVLLDGRDENLTGYPPSFIKIDIPL